MPVLWRAVWSSLAVPAHLPRAHVPASGTTAMAIPIFVQRHLNHRSYSQSFMINEGVFDSYEDSDVKYHITGCSLQCSRTTLPPKEGQ